MVQWRNVNYKSIMENVQNVSTLLWDIAVPYPQGVFQDSQWKPGMGTVP